MRTVQDSVTPQTASERWQPWLAAGGGLLIVLSMTYWGGTAAPGPLFVLGVAVLIASLGVLGLVIAWLFRGPRTTGAQPVTQRTLEMRQFIAVMAAVSGLLFITGGLWDEIWHRLYGVSQVLNDFLWPPHKMLYGSMGINAAIVLVALFAGLRGRGSLLQRLRAEPLIALIGVASAYMMFSAPSDAVWHQIYGLDITAWSLPHILLVGGVALIMITAAVIQVSLLPPPVWQSLRGRAGTDARLRPGELVVVLLLVAAMVICMQVAVTEWEGPHASQRTGAFAQAFWNRPEWLYPVIVVMLALFFGNLALHTLRRPGVATLVMLGVLAFRLIVLALFRLAGSPLEMSIVSQALILPAAMALDAWYALRLRDADDWRMRALGNVLAIAVCLAIALPAIPSFMAYPRINAETVPVMLVMALLLGSWAGWTGAYVGAKLAATGRVAQATGRISARIAWASAAALAAYAVLTVIFILTAQPPVA
jgi:hypothetical protein